MFRRRLYSTCDGSGLLQSSLVPKASVWIRDGTSMLSGRDYINGLHCRLIFLYSRSRVSSGRPGKDHLCERGCLQAETLTHILQQCHSTHANRVYRHVVVVHYLTRSSLTSGTRFIRSRSCHLHPVDS